jgi:hypothetical protein
MDRIAATYAALGRKQPSLVWAKLEILLGLGAVSAGLWLLRDLALFGAPLVVFGGYLTLAGHRTHLYDAMTRQLALLRDAPRS